MNVASGKIEDGRFFGQCQVCGNWQEVRPRPERADRFFTYWRAEFSCCDRRQSASFTLEKEDDDVH